MAPTRSRPLPARLLLASALVLGAGACSDDGSSSDGTPTTERSERTTTSGAPTTGARASTTTVDGSPGTVGDPMTPGGSGTTDPDGSGPPATAGPDGTTEDPTVATTVVDGVSVPLVAATALEAELAAGLEAQVGRAPTGLTCADGLVGIVGRTTACVLVDGDERYRVTVRVTAVDGPDVRFDFEVGDTPID